MAVLALGGEAKRVFIGHRTGGANLFPEWLILVVRRDGAVHSFDKCNGIAITIIGVEVRAVGHALE